LDFIESLVVAQLKTHGALVAITHEDIAKLYSNIEERFGLKYFPEPVLAEAPDGTLRPALCYITPHTAGGSRLHKSTPNA
jgi:hypothetical protein